MINQMLEEWLDQLINVHQVFISVACMIRFCTIIINVLLSFSSWSYNFEGPIGAELFETFTLNTCIDI